MADQPGHGLGFGRASGRGADRASSRRARRRSNGFPCGPWRCRAAGPRHRAARRLDRVGKISVDSGWSAAERAALDLGQHADRADQMLIDRIVMIHVELHHRDDLAEFGNEAAEHARLVHAAQGRLGIARSRSACGGTGHWLRVRCADLLVDGARDCAAPTSRRRDGFRDPSASAIAKSRMMLTGSRREARPHRQWSRRLASMRKSGAPSIDARGLRAAQAAEHAGQRPAPPSFPALRGLRRRCGSDRRHPWRRGNSAS